MARTTTKTAEKPQVAEMPPAPTDNLPAPRPRVAVQPIVPASWQEITAIASAICRAGMAPKSYCKTDNYGKMVYVEGKPVADAEKVAIGIMHGMEVGMTPMASLQSIAVINGMPSLYGDGLLAVIRASGLLEDIEEFVEYDKGNPVSATCKMWRKGENTPSIQTYTIDDAVKAKLWGKTGPWTDHPARMLQWRARGWCGRDKFADVLRGLHSAEEMQDMVDVTPQSSVATAAPEPRRQDYQATAQTNNEPSPGTPPRNQAGGDGQAGGETAPAGGEKAKGAPVQPETRKKGEVTDVEDQSETTRKRVETESAEDSGVTFERFKSYAKFYDWSDTFLQSTATTEAQARAWRSFYTKEIDARLAHENPSARAEMNDTLSLYLKKVGVAPDPAKEREPGEEG